MLDALPPTVSAHAEFVICDCAIENGLHWVLDVAFREDLHRTRSDHSAENFAVMRHIALNLLKAEKTVKVGIKGKRLKCGWDHDYLLKVLLGPQPI
jgi:hypothetical protein